MGALAAIAATASAVAAFVLVGITWRYTKLMALYTEHTQRMVEEMREARAAALLPRVVPVVEYDTTGRGSVYVENIGPGAALDLDLLLTFEPTQTAFRLRRYLLRAGDRRTWNPSRTGQQELHPEAYHPDAHQPHHAGIRLTGRCKDLLGQWHEIEEHTMVLNRWEQAQGPAAGPPELIAPTRRG